MGLVVPRHVGSSQPGVEQASPALAGGSFTTEQPGKPYLFIYLLPTYLAWVILVLQPRIKPGPLAVKE